MSAYIVSDEHISALLGAMVKCGILDVKNMGGVAHVGQLMVNENCVSVNNRYGTTYSAENPKFILSVKHFNDARTKPTNVIQFLKWLDTYEQQCDGVFRWRTTEAFTKVNHLRRALIRKLPGYEAAKWSFDV